MKHFVVICLLIFGFGCSDKSEIESHQESHSSDLIPFIYVADVLEGMILLKITPKEDGLVLYPFQFSYADGNMDGDEVFIGDLKLSTAKIKSDISYSQNVIDNVVTTNLEIDVSNYRLDLENCQMNLAVKICEKCDMNSNHDRSTKQHYLGHVVGHHYHIDIPN